MQPKIDLSNGRWKVFDFIKTVRINGKIKDQRELAKHKLCVAFANARCRQKLSQYKLAKKAGMALATLARMERGSNNPSLSKLIQLAESLDMGLKLVPKKNSLKKRNGTCRM